MLQPEQVRDIFAQTNALRIGHFLLSSGRHSDEYWEKFWVLQYPSHVQTLCAEIVRRFSDCGIEVVMGPTTGGILLAFETARQLGVRALYAEKEAGVRCLRRDLTLAPGTKTLIVDDVMTSGSAVRECLDLAATCGADVVGASVLVDRSGAIVDLGVRLEALLTVTATTFTADQCPLCAQGVPLREPGTTRIRMS